MTSGLLQIGHIEKMTMTSQFTSIVNLFDASVFFSCLVTGPGLGMTSYLECCAGNISTSTVTHANQEKGGLP